MENVARRVLVVDDSLVVHAMMRQVLLGVDDCTFSFARNGREALTHIEKNGEPDLILLDINMPVMSGLECLSHLRALGISVRVPVVLVTTEDEKEDIARGLAAGAREYVTKPFEFDALHATVTRLLDTGRNERSVERRP